MKLNWLNQHNRFLHAKVAPIKKRGSKPMTVCVAALCRWNYGGGGDKPDDWGTVAITASDRMITFGDVQYEPNQTKTAQITPNTVILIAGDYALHSEAIKETLVNVGDRIPKPSDVALRYGRAIQAIKRRHAEDIYLAPLGLNTDLLSAQHGEMSDALASTLVAQMQNYQGEDVEALVVGSDRGNAEIYHVDNKGTVTCANDVGFAAIGSGAWHARSQLMQAGYTNSFLYFYALAAVFRAKKAADTSPGVGTRTDIQLVFRNSIERLDPETNDKLHEVYEQYCLDHSALTVKAVDSLIDFVIERKPKVPNEQNKEQPGGDAKANGCDVAPSPEAARSDEVGKGETQEAAE